MLPLALVRHARWKAFPLDCYVVQPPIIDVVWELDHAAVATAENVLKDSHFWLLARARQKQSQESIESKVSFILLIDIEVRT